MNEAPDLFRSVVETVRHPLLVLTSESQVQAANLAFYRTFKVTESETVGRSLYDLGNGQWNIPALRELLEVLLPTQNPFEGFRVDHDFPTIGPKTMILNARKVEEHNLILLAIEDLTEMARTEEEHKTMVEAVTDYAILRLDENARVATWNQGCERVMGWKADEVMGRHFSVFHTPEEIEAGKIEEELAVTHRDGRFSKEGWRMRSDGSRYWARASLTLIGEGRHKGYTKVVQNINDRMRAEHLTRIVTDNATTAIFMMCQKGRITFMNPAAEAMTGYPFEQIKGHVLHDLVHHHRPDGTALPLDECPLVCESLAGHRVVGHEDMFIRPDGTFYPVRCAASPIQESGGVSGVVLEVHDITEERDGQDALRKALADLEIANRAKDEFLAILAHELRNPLAPVVTSNKLIRRVNIDHDLVRKAVDTIDRQTTQLARLVDDLMDVSRITTGKIELQKHDTNIRDIIDQAVESSDHHLQTKEHTIHIDCPSIPLRADPVRLQQVVSNLISNSAKYTPTGGNISISARREGGTVQIVVKDNGIGIDPDAINRVWDMFYQVRRDHVRSGLGIGLTLVKRLVELHGGTVRASSEGPNKGSTFEVTLPAAQTADLPACAPCGADPENGRMRVLVIDDNDEHASTLCDILLLDGFQARFATGGEKGLEANKEFHPDVLLLDLAMPEMDGFEVMKRLPEPRPYVIAVTGFGQPTDRRRTKAAGFNDHMVKPIDPDKLIDYLKGLD